MSQLSDLWKDKIEEAESKYVEREFAGFPVKARRISLRGMLKAGSLPRALVEHMLRIDNDAEYREEAKTKNAPEHYRRSFEYQRLVVADVIGEPRFVSGDAEPGEGEVSYARFVRLFPQFVEEVVDWVEAGCPDVPVALKGGDETSLDEIASFPDGARGGERVESGDHESGVAANAV
jgi:hypothetical protein